MADAGKLTYCFDIDGTLCETVNGDYPRAKPHRERIAYVNHLFAIGCTIKIFTARGATSGVDWRDFTRTQLVAWGVDHHELIMGKPHADVFIDDKAANADEFFGLGLDSSEGTGGS